MYSEFYRTDDFEGCRPSKRPPSTLSGRGGGVMSKQDRRFAQTLETWRPPWMPPAEVKEDPAMGRPSKSFENAVHAVMKELGKDQTYKEAKDKAADAGLDLAFTTWHRLRGRIWPGPTAPGKYEPPDLPEPPDPELEDAKKAFGPDPTPAPALAPAPAPPVPEAPVIELKPKKTRAKRQTSKALVRLQPGALTLGPVEEAISLVSDVKEVLARCGGKENLQRLVEVLAS